MGTKEVRGFPFFPGLVFGTLKLSCGQARDDLIAVVTPNELAALEEGWAGIVVIEGAPFSHAMIRMLSFGVPILIVNAADAGILLDDTQILLDADEGKLVVGTDRKAYPRPIHTVFPKRSGETIATSDGIKVALRASIRCAKAARVARQNGAESIGLVRSEFLLPDNGEQPDVDFYHAAIQELAMEASGLPITLRLLDLAVDKRPDWVTGIKALNSPLGLQGARLFDIEPVKSVFHAQLKAVDQLSDRFELRLLIPYLVSREELSHWVEEISGRLSNSIPLGAMVETPAGALDMANWFDLVDFAAIGCNDLMQCLFAADRDQPELRHYLDPYSPLLYRFLLLVAESARGMLDRVQLCGILPQLQGVLPLLVGLGYRAFSVEPRLLPDLALRVRQITVADAIYLAKRVCDAKETKEVKDLLGLKK